MLHIDKGNTFRNILRDKLHDSFSTLLDIIVWKVANLSPNFAVQM